jgi:hypothetical protein
LVALNRLYKTLKALYIKLIAGIEPAKKSLDISYLIKNKNKPPYPITRHDIKRLKAFKSSIKSLMLCPPPPIC